MKSIFEEILSQDAFELGAYKMCKTNSPNALNNCLPDRSVSSLILCQYLSMRLPFICHLENC